MKRALITGVFGQDGSYLAELLAGNGYEVHGLARATPSAHSLGIQARLADRGVVPRLHACDLLDYGAVRSLVAGLRPEECYHLAAVHYSSEVLPTEQIRQDRALFEQNAVSTLNLLSAIRDGSAGTRFVLAGSCLMYDACGTSPQSESEPFASRSLYGLSKITASGLVDYFRSAHGLHASTAILYNHESPRRQPAFVTRKIVQGLVGVKRGRLPHLQLGNLHGVKDWGWAPDYARGMSLMAQAASPSSWILATGVPHTVEDFVRETADILGYTDFREVVRVESGLARPSDAVPLIGNPARAYAQLGWSHSVTFRRLVELMVEHELKA